MLFWQCKYLSLLKTTHQIYTDPNSNHYKHIQKSKQHVTFWVKCDDISMISGKSDLGEKENKVIITLQIFVLLRRQTRWAVKNLANTNNE